METWPNEISLHLFSFCEFSTLLNLRQTCHLNHVRVNYILKTRKSFNSSCYNKYLPRRKILLNYSFSTIKMTNFFQYMPSLLSLSFVDLPGVISLADMIKISKSCPQLTELSFHQIDKKFIGLDALQSLSYFGELNNLHIEGWEPSQIVRRGCASRHETIPIHALQSLKRLEVTCNKNTVSKLLHYIVTNGYILPKITSVKFEVRHSSNDIPHLTMRFIDSHPHLKSITFNGLLFTTQEEVRTFYQHLLNLTKLEKLSLINCSVIDKIEIALQRTFLDSLRKKGIQINSIVKSLRHL